MNRAVFILPFIWVVAGCASNSIPDGYTGPKAHVTDTENTKSSSCADFFVVTAIDGRKIKDSISETKSNNIDRGLAMTPVAIGRDVPARQQTFTIVGRTHYAAPILEMMNTVYQVSGRSTFAPDPGKEYIVTGTLTDNYSAVWIAEKATGIVVGQKVEVKGSAKLGLLEK
ncbi:MAG TPA: hypothetical protein VGF97_09645 [Rhizomicrobium sp.]|jgi:hypothetical protein